MKPGWKLAKLGDICEFENGDRGTNYPSKSFRTKEGIAFINAGHLTNDGIDIKNMDYISRERFDLLGSGKVKNGDILFCLRGSLGKYALVNNLSEGAIASSLVIVRNKPYVLAKYLLAYFGSQLCTDMILAYSNGAAQPNLSANSLQNFIIPLPPLAEQQRIVAILDEAFAAIYVAKANAEKNLQNVHELFGAYLQKIFTNPTSNWVERRLGDLAQLEGRIGWRGLTASEYTPKGPLFLSVYSLNYGEYVDFRDTFHISNERYLESPEIMLKKDDVLICKDGAGIGKCGIVGDLPDQATINSSLLLIRAGNSILPKFLYWCLRSPNFQRIVKSQIDGATTPHLYQRNIAEFPISLPSTQKQKEVIEKIDRLGEKTKHLESIYQQKLADLEELKKSLLQQAFNDEL